MYFIEHLCEVAQRDNHLDFVRMMQRDILRVVDAVAPSDGSGAANVKVVRRVSTSVPPATQLFQLIPPPSQVLAGLQQKSILLPETVLEIEAGLAERDTLTSSHHSALSPISPNPTRPDYKANGTKLDKRQIEQRIEEDRERHKRLRESIWAVDDEGEGEFERLWGEGGEVGEDEWVGAEEDGEERGVAGEV